MFLNCFLSKAYDTSGKFKVLPKKPRRRILHYFVVIWELDFNQLVCITNVKNTSISCKQLKVVQNLSYHKTTNVYYVKNIVF